jgi:hypothetical protein
VPDFSFIFYGFFIFHSFFDFCSSWVDLIFSSFQNHCVVFVYFLLFLVMDFSFVFSAFFFLGGGGGCSSFFDFCWVLIFSSFRNHCIACVYFFLYLVVVKLPFFGFFLFFPPNLLLMDDYCSNDLLLLHNPCWIMYTGSSCGCII